MNLRITTTVKAIGSPRTNSRGNIQNAIDLEVSKEDYEKIVATSGKTAEQLAALKQPGFTGDYTPLGGISLLSDNRIRVWTNGEYYQKGDKFELESSWVKEADFEGFSFPQCYNTASSERRNAHRKAIDEKAKLLAAMAKNAGSSVADVIAAALGFNTNAISKPAVTETETAPSLEIPGGK